jgi:hypothetical protein
MVSSKGDGDKYKESKKITLTQGIDRWEGNESPFVELKTMDTSMWRLQGTR